MTDRWIVHLPRLNVERSPFALDPNCGDREQPARALDASVLFILAFLVVPLTPSFPTASFSGLASAVAFVAPAALALMGLALVIDRLGPRDLRVPVTLAGSMFLLTAFSLMSDASRVVADDFVELYKPVAILVVFLFALGLDWAEPRVARFFWPAVVILFAACVAFAVFEQLRLPGSEVLVSLYVRDRDVLAGKAVAFFHTTYFAGTVYLFMACLFLARYSVTRSVWALVASIVALALVLLTQSRSVFLAALVAVAYFSIALPVVSRFRVRIGGAYLSVAAVVFVVVAVSWGYVMSRFPYLIDGIQRYVFEFDENAGRTGSSLALRIGQIVWAWEENHAMLVGSGIGKGYNRYLESLYALYYYRYGLIGLLIYVFVWGATFFLTLKDYSRAMRAGAPLSAATLLGVHVFIVALPIASLSGVMTDQLNLLPIFYGSLGVVYGIRRTLTSQLLLMTMTNKS